MSFTFICTQYNIIKLKKKTVFISKKKLSLYILAELLYLSELGETTACKINEDDTPSMSN